MKKFYVEYTSKNIYSCLIEAENEAAAEKIIEAIISEHSPDCMFREETCLSPESFEEINSFDDFDLPIVN